MIRLVKRLVRRLTVEDPQLTWRDGLIQVQYVINKSVAKDTGLVPNEIFSGTPIAKVSDNNYEMMPPLGEEYSTRFHVGVRAGDLVKGCR